MTRTVICARDARQATRYAIEHGLSPRDYIYASSERVLFGLADVDAVILPGFHERSDAPRIEEHLRIVAAKRPRPTPPEAA